MSGIKPESGSGSQSVSNTDFADGSHLARDFCSECFAGSRHLYFEMDKEHME